MVRETPFPVLTGCDCSWAFGQWPVGTFERDAEMPWPLTAFIQSPVSDLPLWAVLNALHAQSYRILSTAPRGGWTHFTDEESKKEVGLPLHQLFSQPLHPLVPLFLYSPICLQVCNTAGAVNTSEDPRGRESGPHHPAWRVFITQACLLGKLSKREIRH